MEFKFDKKSFIIDGERKFFISGEFPYFRVPKKDWDVRLEKFKEAGGNCVASYVPWIVHEPTEGQILFDDCDERDLTDFMKTVKKHGLGLILRPGPYVYSELLYSGLPLWLALHYPELHAQNIKGEYFWPDSVSYLHPLFLEKVEKWYAAFCREILPFTSQNGGPVVMLQVDNELIGVHEWWGSIDYNSTTMGFGVEGGRYPKYLQEKYKNIAELNKAYGTNYTSFLEVRPTADSQCGKEIARKEKDYHDLYCGSVEDYAVILKNLFIKHGIDLPICHNAAGSTMIPMLKDLNKKMGENFVLGNDNYYSLNFGWAQNNPTPQYFMRVLLGADLLKMLGNPPTVFEMPGGSPSKIPPILKEDLYTCYMANLATGMKGVNYYIYTGGKNVEGTAETTDIYDYEAFIAPDGTVRKTHKALEEFNQVLHKNEWLCEADRFASVQIGTEWQTLRGNFYADKAGAYNTVASQNRMDKCVMLSLLCGKYSGEYIELTSGIDSNRPLVICSPDTMSKRAQENVRDFVENGGKLLLLSTIPEMDENFFPCTILKDYIGEIEMGPNDNLSRMTLIDNIRTYRVNCEKKIVKLPEGAIPFATDGDKKNILGFRKKCGRGEVVYFGGTWVTADLTHMEVFERMISWLGAKPCVENSNRTIFSTLFVNGEKRGVFLLNLYTGVQETNVKVYTNEKYVDLGHIVLSPMEVRFINLD